MRPPAVGERVSAGDWFDIPLCDRRWAVGLIAVWSPRDGVAAYFFREPGADRRPPALARLRPGDADLIAIVSGVRLRSGQWPRLGPAIDWTPERWPLPKFGHIDPISGIGRLATYDPNHLDRPPRYEVVDAETAMGFPPDGLYGAEAVVRILESNTMTFPVRARPVRRPPRPADG